MLHTVGYSFFSLFKIVFKTNINLSAYLQVFKQAMFTSYLLLRFSDKAIIFDRVSSLAYYRIKASPSTKTCSPNTLFLCIVLQCGLDGDPV